MKGCWEFPWFIPSVCIKDYPSATKFCLTFILGLKCHPWMAPIESPFQHCQFMPHHCLPWFWLWSPCLSVSIIRPASTYTGICLVSKLPRDGAWLQKVQSDTQRDILGHGGIMNNSWGKVRLHPRLCVFGTNPGGRRIIPLKSWTVIMAMCEDSSSFINLKNGQWDPSAVEH